MEITNNKVASHALYIAAEYLKDEGFCVMETVNNCRRAYTKQGECEKCIIEMMNCIATKELLKKIQKGNKNEK